MATWSVIQSKSAGGVAEHELTFDSQPTIGNLVICAATKYNGTIGGVSDNQPLGGNSYTQAVGDFVGAKSADIEIYYSFITKTGTPFTVGLVSHSFSSIAIAEFACTGTSQAADAIASSDGHTSAAAPGNIAVAGTDLIVVAVYNGDTVTAPAGYAVLENVPNVPSTDLGLCLLYRLDSTTNPETCSTTLGSVNDWIAVGASFKATPSSAAGSSAITETNDTSATPGVFRSPATLTRTELADTAVLASGTTAAAAAAVSEAPDSLVILGVMTSDADGTLAAEARDSVAGIAHFTVHAGPASVRVEWFYPLTTGPRKPTGFHVYIGLAPGPPDYTTPEATVLYSSGFANTFQAKLRNLTDGVTYAVGVRAYNNSAEEPNTVFVLVTADSTGPLPVVSLTGTAIV